MPWSTIWIVAKDVWSWLARRKKKICLLVVEDDHDEAELLFYKIKDLGWTCDVVDTTEAALPLLLEKRHPVVLIDMRLPHAPGHVLVQKVHKNMPWVHIVCIPGDLTDLRLIPVGIYVGVIGKPVTPDALRDIFQKPKLR